MAVVAAACNQLLGVDEDYQVGSLGGAASGGGAATGTPTATPTGTGTGTAVGGGPVGGSSQGAGTPTGTGGGTGSGTGTGTGEGGAPSVVFTEDFSTGDWPAADWLTEWLGSNSGVYVSSGWGVLDFGTANPAWGRATCLQGPWTDVEVTLQFRFNLADTEGRFHTWLRASGAFGGSSLPQSGYGVVLVNSSGAMSLTKIASATPTVLASGAWTASPDAGTYRMRFRVRGSHVAASVWPDGAMEPTAWTLEATDSSVAGPGDLRLAYIKVSAARWVYVDDIAVATW